MAPSFAYASLIAAAVICLAVPSATEGVYPVGDYESHEYTPRGSYHPAFANRTHTLGTRPETSRRVYHPSFNGRGILLWSLGRSGTSAFWDSMRSWVRGGGMDLNVLCGKKEGFLSEHLNRLRLHRCFTEFPETEPFFTHIKPGHIDRDSDIPTTFEMLRLMRNKGAKVMVIIRRANWLARAVSSAELLMNKTESTRELGSPARTDAMYDYFRRFATEEVSEAWSERMRRKAGEEIDEGEEAARDLGYRIVSFDYDKNNWPCAEVKESVKVAVEEGVLPEMPNGVECVQSMKMGDISHRDLTLEERVGPRAAQLITSNMLISPDSWMLDLSAENPNQAASS